MQGEPQGVLQDRDELGRMKRGYNPRVSKLIRIAAKVEELQRELFPNGGGTVMDNNRLRLAAKHYVTAETCRDPVVAQRATRCAEFLLSRINPVEEPPPSFAELERRYAKAKAATP
jgi:hypothetical protein